MISSVWHHLLSWFSTGEDIYPLLHLKGSGQCLELFWFVIMGSDREMLPGDQGGKDAATVH